MTTSLDKEEDQPFFKKAGERMFAGADNNLFRQAAKLRSQLTHTEEILWGYLKTKPLGFKFRRQHPYHIYILDFYCHQLKLVIEVDGLIHQREEVMRNDKVRESHLKDHGLCILRFANEKLLSQPEEVFTQIANYLVLNSKSKKEKPDDPKSPL